MCEYGFALSGSYRSADENGIFVMMSGEVHDLRAKERAEKTKKEKMGDDDESSEDVEKGDGSETRREMVENVWRNVRNYMGTSAMDLYKLNRCVEIEEESERGQAVRPCIYTVRRLDR